MLLDGVTLLPTRFSKEAPRQWYASILGHTWSLAVEEHFYLIWPVALSTFFAFNWRKAISYLVATSILSVFLCAALIHYTAIDSRFFVERWSFFAGVYIAFGCGAAILIKATPFQVYTRRFFASRWAVILATTAFFHNIVTGECSVPFSDVLRGLGIALFLGWMTLNQRSFIVGLLEIKPLRYLGKISYGVYMWQGFFLSTGPLRSQGQLWPPDPMIGLGCIIVVAPLSYQLFEKPFLSLRKRFRRPPGHSHRIAEAARGALPAPAPQVKLQEGALR